MLTGGNGAVPPASVGILLKTVPADYTITNGTGAVTAIAGNPGGCA